MTGKGHPTRAAEPRPADAAPASKAPAFRQWGTLVGLGTTLFVLNIDVTVVSIVLPVLGERFAAQLSTLQWINNAYSIAFAALVATAGRLADRAGHRTVFLLGLSTFAAGSTLAGLAPGVPAILAGRILQGIGMAAAFAMSFTLTARLFPGRQQGFAVGILVLFSGLAQALGPTAGGLLLEHAGWRWAFLVNLPFCAAGLAIVSAFCPKDSGNPAVSVHVPSAVLLAASFFLLILGFNHGEIWGLGDPRLLASVASGAGLLALLLRWQTRLEAPLLDLELLRSRRYATLTAVRSLFQFSFGALLFAVPLYLQNVEALTPSRCGAVLLVMTLALAITTPIAGKLNDRVGPEPSIVAANVLAVIGYLLLALSPRLGDQTALFAGLLFVGVNVGLMYPASNFAAMQSVRPAVRGAGFGLFTGCVFLLYSVGVAAAGAVLAQVATAQFESLARASLEWSGGIPGPERLKPFVTGARPLQDLVGLVGPNGTLALEIGRESFRRAFSSAMLLLAAAATCGLLLSLGLRRSLSGTEDERADS